jgi:hypothetical protein
MYTGRAPRSAFGGTAEFSIRIQAEVYAILQTTNCLKPEQNERAARNEHDHSARRQIALRERFNFRDNLLCTGPMLTIGCIHLRACPDNPRPISCRHRPVLQALGLGRIGNSHRWGSLNDLQAWRRRGRDFHRPAADQRRHRRYVSRKIPTTPANQASAVLDGIERVCAIAEIKPSALTELMHGTTATTNAVLEGKGRARRAGHHRRLSPDSSGGALLRARRSCGMDNLAKARAARGAR